MKRLFRTLAVFVLVCCCLQATSTAAQDSVTCANFDALRLAIQDLTETFADRYPKGRQYLQRLDTLERQWREMDAANGREDAGALVAARFVELRREALLANPLLDFDSLLLIKRKPLGDARREKGEGKGLGKFLGLPQQSSWQQDEIPNVDTWENEVVVMSDLRGDPETRVLFKPSTSRLVGDLELHYDAQKIAFSMPDEHRSWQIYEIDADGGSLRQLTPGEPRDVHNFDPAYLPDGRIVFASTAPLQGVPCNTSVNVAMTYRMDAVAGMPTTVHISGGFGFVYMLHFASFTPDIGKYQEFKRAIERYRDWFEPALRIEDGSLIVPQGPGVGIVDPSEVLKDAIPLL